MKKINDLSNSLLRKRFLESEFKAETNDAVYMARVSTKTQKDKGSSDDAQEERILEYGQENKLKYVRSWNVAQTASKFDGAKHILAMINFTKTNKNVKHIVFSHQSRSNRVRELARELELLVRTMGVTLHCIRDNLRLNQKSPLEDWLRWDIFNNLNEKYIDDLRKNVMDGTIKVIENGRFPGKAPLGYINYRPHSKGASTFKIEPLEAQYMKEAFELMLTRRYSIPKLIATLAEKYTLERYRAGKPSIEQMFSNLRNPFYYGDFKYDGVIYKGNPEEQPPLISFEQWQAVQNALKENGWKVPMIKTGLDYTGLVRCGGKILDDQGNETKELCGCAVTGEIKRRKLINGDINYHTYWRCSNTARKCSQKDVKFMKDKGLKTYITQKQLEDAMEKMFEPLHFSDEVCQWMVQVLKEHHKEQDAYHKERLAALQRRYKMLDSYISKAYEDKLNGLIEEDLWLEKNRTWKLEREEIDNQLKNMTQQKDDYIGKGVLLIELAQHTKTIYKNADPETKRRLVEIVSSNRYLRDATIEYSYKKPFDMLAKSPENGKWHTQQDSNLRPPD